MAKQPTYSPNKDEEIRRLREELFLARNALLHVMPTNLQPDLYSYSRYSNPADTHGFVLELCQKVVESISEDQFVVSEGGARRAPCPLCHESGVNPPYEGFKVPEGLTMHLLGKGRAAECIVMRTVKDLARDSWKRHQE